MSAERAKLRSSGVALAAALAGIFAALAFPPAAAGATSCVQTYDRSGAVTGRYCAEGLVDPAGPAEAPPVARGERTRAGKPSGVTAAPGVNIQCGGQNGRCRGSFAVR